MRWDGWGTRFIRGNITRAANGRPYGMAGGGGGGYGRIGFVGSGLQVGEGVDMLLLGEEDGCHNYGGMRNGENRFCELWG